MNAAPFNTTSWRLAGRLARREVRQRPWRTVLIAILIALPVAAMTFVDVLLRTDTLTAQDEWEHNNGHADAVLPMRSNLGPADTPPGSRVLSYDQDFRLLRTADGRRITGEITNLPADDPLLADRFRIRGRLPRDTNEAMVSGEVAKKLGVTLGGRLDLDRPLDSTLTVVGIVESVNNRDGRLVVLHPSTPFPSRPGDPPPPRRLVEFPDTITTAEVQAWADRHAATIGLSPEWTDATDFGSPGVSVIQWTWVAGACALTVMGIVIASAFAAGARRQLTTIGQLAANGAPPKVLRRVLVLQGSWTGVVGVVMGLLLGGAALAIAAPHRDRMLGRIVDGFDVRVGDLLPIAALGILAATIAAVVPARSASRVPIMAALAGRRPEGKVPARLTMGGLLLCGAGLGLLALAMFGVRGPDDGDAGVWAMTAILGGVTLLVGACAVAPGYVSVLSPVTARLGGSWRLAVRSLARQRSRTGAVVSAVCATTALMVAWSAVINSTSAQAEATHMPDDRVLVVARAPQFMDRKMLPGGVATTPPAAFVDQVRSALSPGAVTHQLRFVTLADGTVASIADETFLDAMGFDADQRRAVRQTGVAILGDEVSLIRPSVAGLRATIIDDPNGWWERLPRVVVTPERAAALGPTPQNGDVVVQQSRPLTADQRDSVELVFEEGLDAIPRTFARSGVPPVITEVQYYRPPDSPSPLILDAVFAGIAFLFVLFTVASSLALAAAETRGERDVLSVVGAPPRVIRRTSGMKAIVLTVFGVVLALPVGLLPVLLFTRIIEDGAMPFVLPWRTLLLVVVAVPMAAGLLTTAASGIALRLRPVRTSTMAFE